MLMKNQRSIIIFCLMLCISTLAMSETTDSVRVTKDMAFSLAKNFFDGKDVDYYKIESLPVKAHEVLNKDNQAFVRQMNTYPTFKYYQPKMSETNVDDSLTFREVATEKAGDLAALLGDEINSIDSLSVRGPINDADFNTLWSGTYNGRTKVINLENAVVENGKIPEQAFFHNEQVFQTEGYIKVIKLEKIILPEGVHKIGKMAFAYAYNLQTISFPSSLRELDEAAFSNCIRLNVTPLVFPEGFEKIGSEAFVYDEKLKDVVLPSTIKEIGDAAFFQTHITSINFPEGLELIGNSAFLCP